MGDQEHRAIGLQAAHAPGGITYVKSKKPVVAAIAANVLIGAIKFIAAFISGSSAMIAEGIHSVVDSANACILLHGMKRADRKADRKHPFGYSRELYFWTLVVGIMLFALGGGLSILEGISAIRSIGPASTLGNPYLNYTIIAVSMVVEGYALIVAIRVFNRNREGRPVFKFLREAKDPSLFAVMIEDLSDELGLAFALLGTLLAHLTGNMYFDAVASVLIGLLLTGMAFTLICETKALLIGRGIDDESLEFIEDIVSRNAEVLGCNRILTLYLGPDDLLITIEASFKPDASGEAIAKAIDDVEKLIVDAFPQVKRIFIEPRQRA